MDIAQLSMNMSQANLMQQVSIHVLNMTKHTAATQAQSLIKAMELSVQPNLGGNIDFKA
ncbi:Putative motility protein [Paenibacillus sp. UNCCL117]|uniref:YjfB family protein n=1 Tax=unclassified Paenibacillus TaxID=185978 RepID=UPI00090886F7|nr:MULTISPECIES: YjfB family protein [unclassified Paenibacillus]SFW13218.1 Putative motility protein [Paenibacillus sp. UNCCL117]